MSKWNFFTELKRRNVYKLAGASRDVWSFLGDSTNEPLIQLPTSDGTEPLFRNSSKEPARCALEKAFADRDPMLWWNTDQLYDSVRNQTRFQALMERVDRLKAQATP